MKLNNGLLVVVLFIAPSPVLVSATLSGNNDEESSSEQWIRAGRELRNKLKPPGRGRGGMMGGSSSTKKTKSPTASPTESPPTIPPTYGPTERPTQMPTDAPTKAPRAPVNECAFANPALIQAEETLEALPANLTAILYESFVKHAAFLVNPSFMRAVEVYNNRRDPDVVHRRGFILGRRHGDIPFLTADGWRVTLCDQLFGMAQQMIGTCYFETLEEIYWKTSFLLMWGFKDGLVQKGIPIADFDLTQCTDDGIPIPEFVLACLPEWNEVLQVIERVTLFPPPASAAAEEEDKTDEIDKIFDGLLPGSS